MPGNYGLWQFWQSEIVNSIPPTKLSADNARKGCSGYDIITYEIASRLGKFETNEWDLKIGSWLKLTKGGA